MSKTNTLTIEPLQQAAAHAPAPDDQRAARERADRIMALRAALARSSNALETDIAVQGIHLRDFQELDRAIHLLPEEAQRELKSKWEELAVAILRRGGDPRIAAYAVRKQTISLWQEAASAVEVFAAELERPE